MQYHVISDLNEYRFNDELEKMAEYGWRVHSFAMTSHPDGERCYFGAMLQREAKTE